MKSFYLGICVFLLSIYIRTSCCETRVSHIVRSKRSLNGQETYNMFINERGSHFNEKVTFDKINKTATYHVPAHRDISESDFLVDFHLNVTVIRLPGQGVCYVKSRSPTEPSMDNLRKSMDMVSTGKYKIKSGSRLHSSEWTPTGNADLSKLNKNIIEFCRGLSIRKIEKVEQDGVTVSKGLGVQRTKRQMPFSLCKDPLTGYPELRTDCPRRTNYKTTCKFPQNNCVYWIDCDAGIYDVKNDLMCAANHDLINAICCDLSCP